MKNLSIQVLVDKAVEIAEQAKRYTALLFCVFLAIVYGFIVYRVQVLNSSEPSPTDVATQARTASVPHIDPVVLKQLQQLQDNSVSVQSLFSEARSNPFQE